MRLRDAARAACVSRAFLDSWRHHPNLNLTTLTLGCSNFTRKVDRILKRHSGVGVRTLDLEFIESNASNCLDSWLQVAVTPQIKELTLKLPSYRFSDNEFSDDEFSDNELDNRFSHEQYKFPCSLLYDGNRSSIQYLALISCSFQPAVQLGCLRSLTRLHLCKVSTTGDELGCLLSNSLVLERLELRYCHIISLKIPCLLRCLSYLYVYGCSKLQEIDNQAQNISSICLREFPALDSPRESLQFGELLHLKNIQMSCFNAAYYARAELPSIAPNVETLAAFSCCEMVNTPMAPSKFIHLKHLTVQLVRVNLSPAYDYFCLVSFIDASPSLETFNLIVSRFMKHDSIFEGSADLRKMPLCRHHNLRNFKITSFCSAKGLVELTCHVLENTTSLECVTLDTTANSLRCPKGQFRRCLTLQEDHIREAQRALLAIETYIRMKVPATVKLDVLEPCKRCHAVVL
ncbi:hypothetical protein ACP4OV_025579 [Aristida adscensionis]